MLEQKIALGALTAVHTLVVLQYVPHIVHSHRVVTLDLAAVTANNFHAQTSCDHLTFVSVLVVLVLVVPARVVVQLPPLCSPKR